MGVEESRNASYGAGEAVATWMLAHPLVVLAVLAILVAVYVVKTRGSRRA